MSQEKTELNYFDNLPDELILNIGNRIPGIENRNAFALTCQRFYQRYQPERLFLTLLKHITESNLDKVRLILEKYPGLLSRYGAITDPSGCIFKRITAFQYALWAMDLKDMCRIILDSIPKDKTGDELRCNLFSQLQELEDNGINYKKAGVKYNEKYFNLSPLKNALNIYISSYPNWSFDEVKTYWCKTIGGEQKHFPINIRHLYCGHREFILGQLILRRSLTLHDYTNNTEIKWDKNWDGLGVRFAIRHSRKRGAWASADRITAQGDLDALGHFEKNYQEELSLIKSELQEAIRAHTHEEKILTNRLSQTSTSKMRP